MKGEAIMDLATPWKIGCCWLEPSVLDNSEFGGSRGKTDFAEEEDYEQRKQDGPTHKTPQRGAYTTAGDGLEGVRKLSGNGEGGLYCWCFAEEG
jgi:hypothetical protein